MQSLFRVFINVLPIVFFCQGVFSQAKTASTDDAYKILDRLFAKHYNSGNYAYSGIIKLYDENSERPRLIEQKNFVYNIFNNSIDYTIGNVQVINRAPKYYLLIDHDQKLIAYVTNNVRRNQFMHFDPAAFKKIMQSSEAKVTIAGQKDKMQLVVEDIRGSNINSYTIHFNGTTNVIQKIDMDILSLTPMSEEAGTQPGEEHDVYLYRMEINYLKALKVDANNYQPEKNLVSIVGKQITVKQPYRDYTFINQSE